MTYYELLWAIQFLICLWGLAVCFRRVKSSAGMFFATLGFATKTILFLGLTIGNVAVRLFKASYLIEGFGAYGKYMTILDMAALALIILGIAISVQRQIGSRP